MHNHGHDKSFLLVTDFLKKKKKIPPGVTGKVQLKARPVAMCYFSGVGVRTTHEDRGLFVCAYSRVKGPTWRGPLSLGEEQELVVNVEDGEEEYGEEETDEESLLLLFRVKMEEMATSTIPWHNSGYNFLEEEETKALYAHT